MSCSPAEATGGSNALATFATMREIVGTCGGAGCHNDTQAPKLVDDANLYRTLTTFVAESCGNRVLVKPCAPDESAFYLVQKGACGGPLPKMPFGCVDNCTPADYLAGIRAWIAGGAPTE